MNTVPRDYEERVYAGVLGKLIGVYLGRPFEGWSYERISRELGEIKYYVHERLGVPLIVTDDDISGTFTFVRAMSDYGPSLELTPAQIGQTWLNYLIEERTVLWWGGMGNSTEHTAYLRLKAGIPAPQSGSIALNGRVVAEQIGAQIFIDGWAMIAPGDPERAADLARRAGSVSHDGEAVYGAQVLAAMEALAFVEPDIHVLLDAGLRVIPPNALIARLIQDLRDWRGRYADWRETLGHIHERYGYDKYGGNCHMIPNHALIILALLYGEDSFQRALAIVNTAGWDTDCNSGNVGCLMGIKNGLAGLEAGPDWRGPVADRLYLPTADGGRTVTDAVHEAIELAQVGRALAGCPAPRPKEGARFHFDLPGALQGFIPDEAIESRGTCWLENVPGHSTRGSRSLAIHYNGLADGRVARALRETLPAYQPGAGYQVVASPTLYPGQRLEASLAAAETNDCPVDARLVVRVYGADDRLVLLGSEPVSLKPGESRRLEWTVAVPVGEPIAWVGLELSAPQRADGTVYLDWLDWQGTPTLRLAAPAHAGTRWLESWVRAASAFGGDGEHTFRLIQNEGVGLAIQGTRDWQDYRVCATLTPHLARSFGLAARVQGLKRYYALRLTRAGKAQLILELDGTHVLAEADLACELYRPYAFRLEVQGTTLKAWIDGRLLFDLPDAGALDKGAMALLVEEGRLGCAAVEVEPIDQK